MNTERELLAAFLRESGGEISIQHVDCDLRFYPIRSAEELIGIVGFSESKHGERKVGIMQVMYVVPEYRGRDLRDKVSGFLRMLKAEGFTDVEAWALPSMAAWVERVFGVTPRISIYRQRVDLSIRMCDRLKARGV